MTDAHLAEVDPVGGALDAVVIGPAGETVPHSLHIGRDCGGGPIGVAIIGGYASQVLELLVFKLHRTLEPVVAVQIHHHAALIEALVALGEVGLHHETEVMFPSFHLEFRSIIVTEMVVRALLKVRVRGRGDCNDTILYFEGLRLPRPLEMGWINLSAVCQCFGYAVN